MWCGKMLTKHFQIFHKFSKMKIKYVFKEFYELKQNKNRTEKNQ